ncbi:formylglycine-generating enzyme family protein [Fusobacterium animalis]|uniref:formylglycine-generating enzyme family protein n=1 Tax=Fusobacterium animalis TaxID=76859 RepID=UPI0030D1EE72
MREDMVFVKGGKYKLFENNNIEVETFDLEVSKYLVTQKLWTDVMGRNPSLVEDILGMKPVENITWWHTLQFCNKLSELEGLKPIYDLSQIKSAKLYINQLDDEKSINYYEDFLINKNGKIGDFSKTEGYRLPTSIEWEWFAGGGQKAINKGTFGHIFHKSDNLDQIAWYRYNSLLTTHNIAEKIPNELGIFDCIGNVYEWCHNQRYEFKNFKEEKGSTFDNMYKVIMGGSFYSDPKDFYPFIFSYPSINSCMDIGFRFVKTFRGKYE